MHNNFFVESISLLSLFLIFIITFIWITIKLHYFLSWRRKGNSIPGPLPVTLFSGNVPDLRKYGGYRSYLPALHRQYGPIVRFWLGPSDLVVSVADPKLLAKVVNQLSLRPATEKKYLGWLGTDSLLFKSHKESDRFRNKLIPLLTGESLHYLCSVGQECTQKMLDNWTYKRKVGEAINVQQDFNQLTLDIMGICSFGQEFSHTRLGKEIGYLFVSILSQTQARSEEVIPPVWKSSYWRWRDHVSRLHKCAGELIKQRQQTSTTHQTGDLLFLLLHETNENGSRFFSDSEARSIIISFLFAGFDTAAAVLTMTCYLLSQYPDIQAKAQEEVDRVLANQLPTFDNLKRLDYLSQVIKESMRLFPPSMVTMRQLESDLEMGEYCLPKGATFCIPISAIHDDEAIWEQPKKFNPSRFSADQRNNFSQYAHIPFGVGPKSCIGAGFGMVEIKLILAMILQRFSLMPHIAAFLSGQITFVINKRI